MIGRIHVNITIDVKNLKTVLIYRNVFPENSCNAETALFTWSMVSPEWCSVCRDMGNAITISNRRILKFVVMLNFSFSSRTRAVPWNIRSTSGITPSNARYIIIVGSCSFPHNCIVVMSIPITYGSAAPMTFEHTKKNVVNKNFGLLSQCCRKRRYKITYGLFLNILSFLYRVNVSLVIILFVFSLESAL